MCQQYLDMLRFVKDNGKSKMDRTGVGTTGIFGYQNRYDLSKGFPLLTTKQLYTRAITHELLWFLQGGTNTKYLTDNKVNIWNEWAEDNGDLGPIYGHQWVSWPDIRISHGADEDHRLAAKGFELVGGHMPNNTACMCGEMVRGVNAPKGYDSEWHVFKREINQVDQIIHQLKNNPSDRRIILTAWNVSYIEDMALPPCHCFAQFYVMDGKLDCLLYQRSADIFLGVPFNIASYSLLTMMFAQVAGLEVGEFIHTFGDLHIYNNHKEQVEKQLSRKPKTLPTMKLNPEIKSIYDFTINDFELIGYDPDPSIPAPIAV